MSKTDVSGTIAKPMGSASFTRASKRKPTRVPLQEVFNRIQQLQSEGLISADDAKILRKYAASITLRNKIRHVGQKRLERLFNRINSLDTRGVIS